MNTRFLRAVGAATCVYGVAVALRPGLLARPSGLTGADGRVEEATAIALRPVGWRDAVSGAAMVLAPAGPPLALAAAVRMAADFGDAALLGRTLPDRRRRVAAAVVSVGWGALSAAGLLRREPAASGRP
jgi:hypothetical protein